jgi:arylsulfatase A-like enzyme
MFLPSEEEIEYKRALYDDCVYKVDQALGDFFDFLKIACCMINQ